MKAALRERRLDMLKVARTGIPMSRWVPVLAKKHGVSENTLRRDWPRRLGIDGWMLKLHDSDVVSVIGRQLSSIRYMIDQLEDNLYKPISLSLKTTISAELRSLRVEERKIRGILI